MNSPFRATLASVHPHRGAASGPSSRPAGLREPPPASGPAGPAHLLVLGAGEAAAELAARLHRAGHSITLGHGEVRLEEIDLLVAVTGDRQELERQAEVARRLLAPWVLCCAGPAGPLAAWAYHAGALAVLPGESPPEVVQQTVERVLATLQLRLASRPAAPERQERRFRAGEAIGLGPESVLAVKQGVVALTVLHEDGAEVLLGLYGPGFVLCGHPEDSCCLELRAHTEVTARVQPWAEASRSGAFAESLRTRLRLMEAWAAMQARPQLEQRIQGILAVLAEQFGRPAPGGTLVDVRITHAQLASAVGATRATVTRLLGRLHRQRALRVVSRPDGKRFCLPDGPAQQP